MKFVVGIGNPGKAYDSTRHNVGFEALDLLAEKWADGKKLKWVREAKLDALSVSAGSDVRLVKPQAFVNNTGETVAALVDRRGASPEDILVVCDDVNLALGKLRLRPSGSAGGHHGLESVIAQTGSDGFPRLRIGVGNEQVPKDLTGFVLGRFKANEREIAGKILEKAVLVCEAWAREGYAEAEKRLSQLQSKK